MTLAAWLVTSCRLLGGQEVAAPSRPQPAGHGDAALQALQMVMVLGSNFGFMVPGHVASGKIHPIWSLSFSCWKVGVRCVGGQHPLCQAPRPVLLAPSLRLPGHLSLSGLKLFETGVPTPRPTPALHPGLHAGLCASGEAPGPSLGGTESVPWAH